MRAGTAVRSCLGPELILCPNAAHYTRVSHEHLQNITPTERRDLKQSLTSCDQIGVRNRNVTHIWRLGGDERWSMN